MSTLKGQWIFLMMLAVLTISCASQQRVAFTVIERGQGIHSSGGGTILNDFSTVHVQREADDAKIYYDQCRRSKHNCGTYIAFHYDDRVSQADLQAAITITVTAFHYAQPIYVRVQYDTKPRGIPLYADVSVGQVELLP